MLGVNLGVSVIVEKTETGTEEVEDLLKNETLSKIQKSLIRAISKAYSMDSSVLKYGYTMGQVEIGLTTIPSIRMSLISVDSRSFSTTK